MLDEELIGKIRHFKEENHYTLFDLSKMLDIHVSTLERWIKTSRINKLYAKVIRERLGL